MKRFLAIILILSMCLGLCVGLTGCGKNDTVDPNKASELKIVMVTDKNCLGDGGINDSCWAGLKKAADEYKNLTVDVIEAKKEYALAIADAVEEEPDIIFCVSKDMAGALNVVASQYDDKIFILFDAELPDQFNVTTVKFNPEQKAYLAGVAAALATKKNVAGFIADEESVLNSNYLWGFTAGIVSTNSKCFATTNYIGADATARQAKETAVAQFKLGADVILNVLGSGTRDGVMQAADERGFNVIGINGNVVSGHENSILACVQENGEAVCYAIAKRIIEGTFDGSTMYFNMSSDAYIVNDLFERISDEDKEKINQVMDNLKTGKTVAPYDYATYQAYLSGTAFASSDAEQIAAQEAAIKALEAAAAGTTSDAAIQEETTTETAVQ